MLLPLLKNKCLHEPLLQCNNTLIDVATFLSDVIKITRLLPQQHYIINLCENRYYFLVSFAAALIQKQVTIFPQHQKPNLLSQLQQQYSNSAILTDTDISSLLHKAKKKLSQLALSDIPMLDDTQVACVFFTSGSSASATPHEKQWGQLVKRTKAVAAALGLDKERYCLVATVPLQHLFGFEHIAMLGLQTKSILHNSQPFFPDDLRQVLSEAKFSPYVISTPYHLDCCIRSEIAMPVVGRLLSSTAPLSMSLAKKIELYFQTKLQEIYGCTELGAIAIRRTAVAEHWQLLKGLTLLQKNNEHCIEVAGSNQSEMLPDIVKQHSDRSFSLLSRKEDTINIAGKRSSKLFLTKCLTKLTAVQDAAVYFPTLEAKSAKIIAIVVAPNISEQAIKEELRSFIDNIFIPKQIIKVAKIARNSLGKITQHEMLKLILSHSSQQALFKVPNSHPSLPGHFPNNPLIPGVVTLDNIIDCFQRLAPECKLKQFIQVKFHEKLRADQQCTVSFSWHRKGIQFKAVLKQQLIVSGIFTMIGMP